MPGAAIQLRREEAVAQAVPVTEAGASLTGTVRFAWKNVVHISAVAGSHSVILRIAKQQAKFAHFN